MRFPPQSEQQLPFEIRESSIEERKARRRKNAYVGKISRPGSSQPSRWHKVLHDVELNKMNLTVDDAHHFLRKVLGWSNDAIKYLSHDVESLDKLIVSMLARVPFHNLTLLTRERRPPTMEEIKDDMMKGLGGPCSVVNAFFAVLLDKLGFGPHVYLLRCVPHLFSSVPPLEAQPVCFFRLTTLYSLHNYAKLSNQRPQRLPRSHPPSNERTPLFRRRGQRQTLHSCSPAGRYNGQRMSRRFIPLFFGVLVRIELDASPTHLRYTRHGGSGVSSRFYSAVQLILRYDPKE